MIDTLQLESHTLIRWFNLNFFKLNADKCKLLVSQRNVDLSLDIGGEKMITCEKSVKLLGIKIDNQLTFSEHISNICKKKSA